MKYVRVNERIMAKTVRVVGPDGEQLGVFPREQAIKRSDELDLDLVEVAPQADPPVLLLLPRSDRSGS